MRLLPLILSSNRAASFYKEYPAYQGNSGTLNKVISLSGTVQSSQAATCLDDVLTEDHLMAIVSALGDSNLKSFGFLLQELSPQRFDSLCFALDGRANVESLVSGYLNEGSRWKQAFMLPIDAPVTAENAHIHRGQSEELCKLMEDRPWDILTQECRQYCADQWELKPVLIRKWLWNPTSPFVPNQYTMEQYFCGREEEFFEWFKWAFERNLFRGTSYLPLPISLKKRHLLEIQDYLKTSPFAYYAPTFQFSYYADASSENLHFLVESMNNSDTHPIGVCPDYGNALGFDHELFLDKWVMAKLMSNRQKSYAPIICNLERRLPMSLGRSFSAALTFGNFDILNNTLLVISQLHSDANASISNEFWLWLGRFTHSVITKDQIFRLRSIFGLLKPHLVFNEASDLISDKRLALALLPVILDMAKSPNLYWSPALLKSGMEWAQAFYNVYLTDEERLAAKQSGQLCLPPPERGSLSSLIISALQYRPHNELLFQHMDVLSQLDLLPKYAKTVKKSLAWIALSSNHKLLDLYLDYYSAGHILSLCEHASLRQRISLMLHLSHKTTSYTPDDEPVNKNSIFFRDWVMCRISDHPADLKLLYWYFINRTCRNYQGFDLYSGDRILGLQGTIHTPHDNLCIKDLLHSK